MTQSLASSPSATAVYLHAEPIYCLTFSMRFLRNFITNLGKRRYAQVHDVRVEYSRYPAKEIWEKESDQGEMSQSLNGKSKPWGSASLVRQEYVSGNAESCPPCSTSQQSLNGRRLCTNHGPKYEFKHPLTHFSFQEASRAPLHPAAHRLHPLGLLRSAQVRLRQPQHCRHCHGGVPRLQRRSGQQPTQRWSERGVQVVFVCVEVEGGV